MANNERFRAAQRQRSLVKTLLLFSGFLLISLIGIMILLQILEQGSIRENPGSADEPKIITNSSTGIRKQTYLTLYFRHGESDYLATRHVLVDVAANESSESAAINKLIEGPGTSSELSALLTSNTQLIKTEAVGDTLRIDFNDKILWRPITNPSDRAIEAKLRLAAQSIANTVIDCGRYSRVQILVEGKMPKRSDFGFEGDHPLEALTYNDELVMDAKKSLNNCMEAIKNREWQDLYQYLSTYGSGLSKNDFTALCQSWEEESYRVYSWDFIGDSKNIEAGVEVIRLDIHYIYDDGREITREGLPIAMRRENERWKIPLDALTRLVQIPD